MGMHDDQPVWKSGRREPGTLRSLENILLASPAYWSVPTSRTSCRRLARRHPRLFASFRTAPQAEATDSLDACVTGFFPSFVGCSVEFTPAGSRFMSKGRDRTISQRPDGTWENKRNDASRASSVHDTQKAAQDAAREMLKKQGGGELTTKGVNGRIRDKDTVPPGNDPRKTKG